MSTRQPAARPAAACRAFDRIRAEHVDAGGRQPARAGRTPRWSRPSAPTCRPTTTRCRRCWTWPPSAWRAPGARCATSTPWLDTPALRAAYTENLPRITEFHTRWAPTSGCTPSTRRSLAAPTAPQPEHGAAQGAGQRAARLRAVAAPSCRARRSSASRGSRSAQAELRADASPSTCSTPPTASPTTPTRPSSTACPTT